MEHNEPLLEDSLNLGRVGLMSAAGRRCSLYLAAIVATAAGCGEGGAPKMTCYPVTGQLFVKSQPAAGALVVLSPQDGDARQWPGGFPRGQVEADGSFAIETYGNKDGAPAGDYTVLVTWTGGDSESEEAQSADKLRGRYSDPERSKLKAKVEAGGTKLPKIELP